MDGVIFEGDTAYGHYMVVDTIYSGRKARVLYSGKHQAAQSGIALDDNSEQLFDYNERFMELCRGLLPESVLLLGGGACTLPRALLAELPEVSLDIVELDPDLLDIAQQYFGFQPAKNTRLHVGDARTFLDKTSASYDLVLVDVFTHDATPRSLQTHEAAASMARCLKPGGAVAMNVIAAYTGVRSGVLRKQAASLMTRFKSVDIFPASYGESSWLPQNFIVTAHNTGFTMRDYFRYQPCEPLQVRAAEAISDSKEV